MLAILIALSILAVLPAILVWPHLGVLAWYWVGLMNPHRFAWGPLENQRYAAAIGAVLLLAWFLSRESKRIPFTPVTAILGVFTLWITITTFAAHLPEQAWINWEKAFKILLITFVTMALINTRERLHALIWLIVVCLGFYGFKGGVFTVLSGGQYHVFGPPNSFIGDNNQLALALIMTVPLIIYLYQHTAHRLVRLGLVGVALGCFFSIIGSQSRGAFLALCIMGAYLAVKSRHRLAMGAAVVGVALVGVWFVPDSWVERMESMKNYEEDASAVGRIRAWTFATKVAIDHPITGGGFDVQFDEAYYMRLVPEALKNRNFHSAYFEVLGEHGFIGLFLFLSLLAATWLSFGRLIRRTRDDPGLRWAHDLGRMAQVSLLGYASCGAFLNLAFYDLFYLLVAMAPITAGLVAQDARTSTQEQEDPAPVPARARPAGQRGRGGAHVPRGGGHPAGRAGVTPRR